MYRTSTVGPLAENCYLVGAPAGDELVIVDPGAESDRIAAAIAASGRRPVAILLTHGHIDHIAHCAHLAEQYGIGVWVHREDQPLLAGPQWPELAEALAYRPCPEPAGWLEEGSPVRFAGLDLEVVHTPGHTPGGVCFVERASRQALVGDTLSTAACVPIRPAATADPRARSATAPSRWKGLLLLAGARPETWLAEERLENPFVGARARYAPGELSPRVPARSRRLPSRACAERGLRPVPWRRTAISNGRRRARAARRRPVGRLPGGAAAYLRQLRTWDSPRSANRALAALRGFFRLPRGHRPAADDPAVSLVAQRTLRHRGC